MDLWKVDLHSHTIYSVDSITKTAKQIEQARAIGLDKLAITEHNRLDGALAAKALDPDLIIVGEEIRTTHGEIIAYFVTEEVPRGLSPQETIARLRDQGAVISIPHPLDSLRSSAMGLDMVLQIIDDVDALEVLNARCLRDADNEAAANLAAEHNRLATAGSDAHTPGELSRAYMEMPPFEDNGASFLASLQHAQPMGRTSSSWVRVLSNYAKVHKRFFPFKP